MQPHALSAPPPPQVSGALQTPQSRTPSQPSETVPHVAASLAQVVGVQGVVPQRLAPLPPQNRPLGQLPHSTVPPQPLEMVPHSALSVSHVLGGQLLASLPSGAIAPSTTEPPSAAASACLSGPFKSSKDEVKLHDTAAQVTSSDARALTSARRMDKSMTQFRVEATLWPVACRQLPLRLARIGIRGPDRDARSGVCAASSALD